MPLSWPRRLKPRFPASTPSPHPQTAGDNVILGEAYETLYGNSSFTDEVCGLKFELSPLSFSQVNSQVSQRLYRDALPRRSSLPTTECLTSIPARGPLPSWRRGSAGKPLGWKSRRRRWKTPGPTPSGTMLTTPFFIRARQKDFAAAAKPGLAADVIFLDPPRKGAHPDVLCAAAAASPAYSLHQLPPGQPARMPPF